MELKFVEDSIVELLTTRGRRGQNLPWTEFIEELYKHPERWAEFPHKVNSSATAYVHIEKFQNIEVRLTGGNNLAKTHPDKKQWTVFMKFVPETPAKIEEPKAPSKKK
jgi:hypothetical protein